MATIKGNGGVSNEHPRPSPTFQGCVLASLFSRAGRKLPFHPGFILAAFWILLSVLYTIQGIGTLAAFRKPAGITALVGVLGWPVGLVILRFIAKGERKTNGPPDIG